MSEQPLKLNIGGGVTELEGFVCVDRRNGDEAYPLPYEDGTVDEIRASHILEHFGWDESVDVMREWSRVLKPGGRLAIAVPDFEFIADQYVRANGTRSELSRLLFSYTMGGQTDGNDFHKSAYDEASLTGLMQAVGMRDICRWESEIEDCAKLPVSLNLEGTKSEYSGKKIEIPKTTAIMSTSRLAFTENLFCAMQVFAPRGVELIKHTGAYWGQCLERVMAETIEETEAEWIVTLDYDTVFTAEQFDRLCFEMATHPEADAIAPWQCKRETDQPLCWFVDAEGKHRAEIELVEFNKDITQTQDAHFGLTLFRVSSLKKMKHPWFWAKPNSDGEWGDGRLDDDIYFWRKWKETGNTLYLANKVSIGHLQHMVTWVRKDNRMPIHQYITDFQKEGPPKEAW